MTTAKTEVYSGRLVADGQGNLLADEGDRAGDPVAHIDGQYKFLKKDDLSHNEMHHQNFALVGNTNNYTESDFGTAENPAPGFEHHFEVQLNDPHFNGLSAYPDKVAPKKTGHTEAYSE